MTHSLAACSSATFITFDRQRLKYGRFAVYFVGSRVIGIVMSKLIEYPIFRLLRLRDRILPASYIVPVAA
jgi:hypothetical protein